MATTSEENILKSMLDRTTDPSKDTMDELGAQMYCMLVRSDVKLIEKALELILQKIRADNETEAIRAIALLEECMTNCGSDFQNEVAKFRFLNDLIRVVSLKYNGAKTPAAIKKRITDCLLLWTTEFPQKTKIRDVYDMLKKEEVVSIDTTYVAEAKRNESTLGIDEKLLHELLHSKDPENLKRANLLIQQRVTQDARRTELALQHKSEINEVQTIVTLLNQMLDSYESEGSTSNEDNLNLMRELYLSCKKHKPIMIRMPELLGNNENELLGDALEASEFLQDVLKRYKQTIVHPPKMEPSGAVAVTATASSTLNADLLSELLSDVSTSNGVSDAVDAVSTKTNPLDELTEIFGADSIATKAAAENSPVELLGSFDLLNDVQILPTGPSLPAAQATTAQPSSEKRAFRDLPEIDKLSEKLFQMSLPTTERINSFKKEPEKLTLNDLAKEKTIEASTPANLELAPNINRNTLNDLNTSTTEDHDDLMLSNTSEPIIEQTVASVVAAESTTEAISTSTPSTALPFKHLSDIEISLDDVVPTAEERLLLDDDIKITLNFTEDRPSRHVSVVVISVLNKSKEHIKDFHFEASVKKPCKVRLLPPTAFTMSPYKPFRPPTPINQVMLLLNPTRKTVDITCIVGYKSGDDPDPIKESLVAKNIPYVD